MVLSGRVRVKAGRDARRTSRAEDIVATSCNDDVLVGFCVEELLCGEGRFL